MRSLAIINVMLMLCIVSIESFPSQGQSKKNWQYNPDWCRNNSDNPIESYQRESRSLEGPESPRGPRNRRQAGNPGSTGNAGTSPGQPGRPGGNGGDGRFVGAGGAGGAGGRGAAGGSGLPGGNGGSGGHGGAGGPAGGAGGPGGAGGAGGAGGRKRRNAVGPPGRGPMKKKMSACICHSEEVFKCVSGKLKETNRKMECPEDKACNTCLEELITRCIPSEFNCPGSETDQCTWTMESMGKVTQMVQTAMYSEDL